MNKISKFGNIKKIPYSSHRFNLSTSTKIIQAPSIPTSLTHIEKAKALIYSRISGSLFTISNDEEAEEKTMVPYVLHPSCPGNPIIAMSDEESHCTNLINEPKCALTVFNLFTLAIIPD
jgi:hypothetical protein